MNILERSLFFPHFCYNILAKSSTQRYYNILIILYCVHYYFFISANDEFLSEFSLKVPGVHEIHIVDDRPSVGVLEVCVLGWGSGGLGWGRSPSEIFRGHGTTVQAWHGLRQFA